MKIRSLARFSTFGISTILFKRKKPILGTIIVTDKCNLTCLHCAVNNVNSRIYKYEKIKQEMLDLYKQGIRILFYVEVKHFYGKMEKKQLEILS